MYLLCHKRMKIKYREKETSSQQKYEGIRNKKMITGKQKVGWTDMRKQNKHEKDNFIPLKKNVFILK